MARYPLIFSMSPVRDGCGNTLSGATVQVFDNDTTTPSTIYAAKTGGSALANGIIVTDAYGMAKIYVDDADYPLVSLFDVSISKESYSAITVTDLR